MKKKTGGDSTAVASKKTEFIGGKKRSDNSTDYNKKGVVHNVKPPTYPYGQQHLSKSAVKPGASKASNSKAIATNTKKK